MRDRYLIGYSSTSSLSGTLFLVRLQQGAQFDRGSLATFSFDGTPWGFPADVPWTKRVLGLPGDAIEVRSGTVVIAGRPVAKLHGTMMEESRLRSIRPGPIPLGFLFVAGDSPRSFDSRYREFGLVPATAVIGEATLLM